MAVTAPASLSKIKAEFGGPGNLKAYYRGGTYVANIAANAGVPTSGDIKISQFVGATKYAAQTVAHANDTASLVHSATNGGAAGTAASVTGGTGTKNFSITRVSGDATLSATINATTGATTYQQSGTPATGIYSATFRVSNNDGVTTATHDHTFAFTRT